MTSSSNLEHDDLETDDSYHHDQYVKKYEKRIEDKIKAGLFSRRSKAAYLGWFNNLSLEDKQNFLLNSDLEKPERAIALATFRRLPRVIREELKFKFVGADLEERQKIVGDAMAVHEKLKAKFLKLPEKKQKNMRERFKASNFNQRERLLKSIGINIEDEDTVQENSTEQKNIHAFHNKMIRLTKDNLLSPLSMRAYREWFENLSPIKKEEALRSSDLDNPERQEIRDKFLSLPEEVQKPYELKFRNADLDGRKVILTIIELDLDKNKPIKYSKEEMRLTLKKLMNDPELVKKRLFYTMALKAAKLRQLAEYRYESNDPKTLAKKASAKEEKTDEHHVFNLETLEQQTSEQNEFKRYLMKKENEGDKATITNTVLQDRNNQTVTAEDFGKRVVPHLKREFIASLINKAHALLPKADIYKLSEIAKTLDPRIELINT